MSDGPATDGGLCARPYPRSVSTGRQAPPRARPGSVRQPGARRVMRPLSPSTRTRSPVWSTWVATKVLTTPGQPVLPRHHRAVRYRAADFGDVCGDHGEVGWSSVDGCDENFPTLHFERILDRLCHAYSAFRDSSAGRPARDLVSCKRPVGGPPRVRAARRKHPRTPVTVGTPVPRARRRAYCTRSSTSEVSAMSEGWPTTRGSSERSKKKTNVRHDRARCCHSSY